MLPNACKPEGMRDLSERLRTRQCFKYFEYHILCNRVKKYESLNTKAFFDFCKHVSSFVICYKLVASLSISFNYFMC